MIGPGKLADFVLLRDLERFSRRRCLSGGNWCMGNAGERDMEPIGQERRMRQERQMRQER